MRIVLGVTGCIAAYKSAILLRLLQEKRAEVFPVMTASALQFLAPLTLEKLSGHKVITSLFEDSGTRIEHIDLARHTDLLLVAPATANLIAKFAHGIADDFLTTLYVSTTTPVVLAPAMNVEMWNHWATRENVARLRQHGVRIVEPEAGYLACGELGEGRLADPHVIADIALEALGGSRQLEGLRILVTAGPTIEDIDPVRFLSNRSSGRMGYAVAQEARRRGGSVTLVSGPTQLETPPGMKMVQVRSAQQMRDAVLADSDSFDIIVMVAAVADWTPAQRHAEKLKKEEGSGEMKLRRTADILKTLGEKRRDQQTLVGFAAETSNHEESGRQKLLAKGLDLVFINDVSRQDRGIASDQNQLICLDRQGTRESSELLPKDTLARFVWDRIVAHRFPPTSSQAAAKTL